MPGLTATQASTNTISLPVLSTGTNDAVLDVDLNRVTNGIELNGVEAMPCDNEDPPPNDQNSDDDFDLDDLPAPVFAT